MGYLCKDIFQHLYNSLQLDIQLWSKLGILTQLELKPSSIDGGGKLGEEVFIQGSAATVKRSLYCPTLKTREEVTLNWWVWEELLLATTTVMVLGRLDVL